MVWRSHRTAILSLCGCVVLSASIMATRAAWSWFRPLPRLDQIRGWADAGRWDQAAEAIRLHLDRRPHEPAVLMMGARIAAAQGQLERCAELLEQVPPGASQKLEAMFRQGQALRDAGRASRAEQVWRELLGRSQQQPIPAPWRQTIQAELVSLYSLERRVPEARELVWQMYPSHLEKWRLLIALARLEGRGTKPQVAIALLDELLQRDATDLEARLGRARYLVEASRWQEATEDAQRCRSQDPHNPRVLEVVLQCHFGLQQWAAADELLAAPDLDPTSPTIWRLRGVRCRALGDWKNSQACFEESLRLKPTDAITHYQFAQLLLLCNDRPRAEEHQDQFRNLDAHQKAVEEYLAGVVHTDPQTWTPPDPNQCTELAEHVLAVDRIDEARGWLNEALRQQPDHREAKQALERLSERVQPLGPQHSSGIRAIKRRDTISRTTSTNSAAAAIRRSSRTKEMTIAHAGGSRRGPRSPNILPTTNPQTRIAVGGISVAVNSVLARLVPQRSGGQTRFLRATFTCLSTQTFTRHRSAEPTAMNVVSDARPKANSDSSPTAPQTCQRTSPAA